MEERDKYPEIPMTESDKKLIEEAKNLHPSEWFKIDTTLVQSRECYDILSEMCKRLYNYDQADYENGY